VGRAAIAIGAVLIVGGGAALGYALTRKDAGLTPKAAAAMTDAVAKLDGEISKARTAVDQNAQTLSTQQSVRAAVATDETTVREQIASGALSFVPAAGEVIELGVVIDGTPTPLVVRPEGGRRSPHAGKPGSYAGLMGDQIEITKVVAVVPTSDSKGPSYLVVSRPLDLKPSIDRLVAAGVSGRFEIGGTTRNIGQPPAGATLDKKPLSEPGAQLVVAMSQANAMPMPIVGAGAGAAGLGLVLLLIGLFTGRQPAMTPQQAFKSMPTLPSTPPESTKLSQHGVAAGTPSPIDASGAAINPSNLGAGAMIGRWEVVRRLGSGGMADVYLAHAKGEAGFEKLVAIKVMHGHLARNQRAVEHFLDEARLAARIIHPNVVAIQDLGKIGNDYVIVMDYVEGVDLERLLASARAGQRPVPIDVGLGILCRICDGLNAAHKATAPDGTALGIIHRDVKSANVLVSKQGGVKVVDFGIAKATAQSHNTIAGETKGTPSMMAPEQRVGEAVDVRVDVYSVAAVAYEVLTNHAVNLDLAALAHLGVENWPHLPLPTSLRPQLPPELDGILLGAMSFERDKRPADCAAFESVFEAVMKQHGLSASDKDIARWVDSELRVLAPAFQGASTPLSKPAGA
jgi:serine/threonine-protein kinase